MEDPTILALIKSNDRRASHATTMGLVAVLVSVAVMMFVTLLFIA